MPSRPPGRSLGGGRERCWAGDNKKKKKKKKKTKTADKSDIAVATAIVS